jgi:hypothetical protein
MCLPMCCCAGFLQQFAAVVDDANPAMHMGKVLRELSGGRSPNRVLCTGHSLGGALATLGGRPFLLFCVFFCFLFCLFFCVFFCRAS